MLFYTLFSLFSAAVTQTSAFNLNASQHFKLGAIKPVAFHHVSPNLVAKDVLTMRRSGKRSKSSAYLNSIRRTIPASGYYGIAPIYSIELGEEFLTTVKWAGKPFTVILDTGSSDTWLVQQGFECVDALTSNKIPQSTCDFGPAYPHDRNFSVIDSQNFNTTYGDGEFVTGKMGYESVSLAGITVPQQEVAVVNYAGWFGDKTSSGLVGLAFPAITSAFAGNDPTADSSATQKVYNPLFTNMYQQGRVAPVFSIAIERYNNTGVLALGGLPPVLSTPPFASTPFQYLTLDGPTRTKYQFYIISVGVSYANAHKTSWSHPSVLNDSSGPLSALATRSDHRPSSRPAINASQSFQMIVDSGTTLIYLPDGISRAVNKLFSPPANFSGTDGVYYVSCGAKPPDLSINIGGMPFKVDKRDLILPNGDGTCVSGVNDAGDFIGILGGVFLKSVVAVFDVGAAQMRFAHHSY